MIVVPALLEKVFERPKNKTHEGHKHKTAYKVLAIVSLLALVLQTSMLMLSLFEQPLPYTIANPGAEPIDSPEFARIIGQLTGGGWSDRNGVEVLTNGNTFYAAELDAIRNAKRFVHIECYIFQQGRVTDQVLHALEERAQAGVEVRLVIDAIGSAGFPKSRFERWKRPAGRSPGITRSAGTPGRAQTIGRIARCRSWTERWASRAARVSPTSGFTTSDKDPQWRDTMVRIEGAAAADLNATFAENWLEVVGRSPSRARVFPCSGRTGQTHARWSSQLADGRPFHGGASVIPGVICESREVGSHHKPLFLPDKSLRAGTGARRSSAARMSPFSCPAQRTTTS